MSDSLSAQAHKEMIEQVKAEKPSSFTVGGHYIDGKLVGGITYDRKLSNLWGFTAYARAYWDDLPVTTRPKVEAGGEITKTF